MLVWPERTAPHHGASPLYGTTWVSIRHGSCEPTASGPGEPAASLGASKVTWVITQIGSPQTGKDNGQGLPMRRLTGVEVRLWNIPITVGEALTSPQAHTPPPSWGLGRFSVFFGVGGIGNLLRGNGLLTPATPGTASLLPCCRQELDEHTRTHRPSNARAVCGPWVQLSSQGIEMASTPTSFSIPLCPISTWLCRISVCNPFSGCEMDLIVFTWIAEITNKTY